MAEGVAMSDRSSDWMAQAKPDLEHASKDVADGYYEHACFEAEQAAEKAVRAVYLRRHEDARGHRVDSVSKRFRVWCAHGFLHEGAGTGCGA